MQLLKNKKSPQFFIELTLMSIDRTADSYSYLVEQPMMRLGIRQQSTH